MGTPTSGACGRSPIHIGGAAYALLRLAVPGEVVSDHLGRGNEGREGPASVPDYLTCSPWSWPACLTISRHAFSHTRHSLAQAVMCSSSGNFSHSLAQAAQASAQVTQMIPEKGPPRDTTCAAAAQMSAQSWHVISVVMCPLLPAASWRAQWVVHMSHSRWQSEHAFSHACSPSACSL